MKTTKTKVAKLPVFKIRAHSHGQCFFAKFGSSKRKYAGDKVSLTNIYGKDERSSANLVTFARVNRDLCRILLTTSHTIGKENVTSLYWLLSFMQDVCLRNIHSSIIRVKTTAKKILEQRLLDIVSLTLFLAICRRKNFAIVSVTIGLCQKNCPCERALRHVAGQRSSPESRFAHKLVSFNAKKWAPAWENQQFGFWPGLTHTRLYSYWGWLEA